MFLWDYSSAVNDIVIRQEGAVMDICSIAPKLLQATLKDIIQVINPWSIRRIHIRVYT